MERPDVLNLVDAALAALVAHYADIEGQLQAEGHLTSTMTQRRIGASDLHHEILLQLGRFEPAKP